MLSQAFSTRNTLHHTGLTALNLSGNRIGDAGAIYLANMATNCSIPLRAISLDRCEIGDSGCVAIAHADSFASLTNLTALSLQDNRIGPSGAAALATWIRNPKCTLVRLALHFNPMIIRQGLVDLSEALRQNESISEPIGVVPLPPMIERHWVTAAAGLVTAADAIL